MQVLGRGLRCLQSPCALLQMDVGGLLSQLQAGVEQYLALMYRTLVVDIEGEMQARKSAIQTQGASLCLRRGTPSIAGHELAVNRANSSQHLHFESPDRTPMSLGPCRTYQNVVCSAEGSVVSSEHASGRCV